MHSGEERKLRFPVQEDPQQTISRLRFEAANMRLWKEKDAADAETSKRALAQQLVNEINDREGVIANLTAEPKRLKRQLRALERQLRQEQSRLEALASELRAVLDSYFWRCTAPLRAAFRWSAQTRAVSAAQNGKEALDSHGQLTPAATFDEDYPMPSSWSYSFWSVEKALGTIQETRDVKVTDGADAATAFVAAGRSAWNDQGTKRLDDFLANGRQLLFTTISPVISIIVVSFNNPHLLFLALQSIANNADVAYEVIIVDNGSDEKTQRLLGQIQGAKVIRKNKNIGFPAACNEGAALAIGDYVCFLNNDALLDESCLSWALDGFTRDPTVGVVGGKLLSADGLLQEAGAILWCDGTTNGYGAGGDPSRLDYNFRRPVDYCSGAFMLTPRHLFRTLGGFDAVFAPGYYEDVDYCTRVWSQSRKVIYEPRAVVRHYVNASSINKAAALSLVIRNHEIFYKRWREYLTEKFEPKGENLRSAAICDKAIAHRIVAIVSEIPNEADVSRKEQRQALERLTLRGFVTCAATKIAPSLSDYSGFLRDVQLVDATVNTSSVLPELLRHADLIWAREPEALELISAALSELGRLTVPVEFDSAEGI